MIQLLLLLAAFQDPAPAGELRIENGARVTRFASVRVQVGLTAGSPDGLRMFLTTDPKAAPVWVPFASSVVVELPPGDGDKTLHLRLIDAQNRGSAPVSAVIRLDTTPPAANVKAPDRGDGFSVRVEFDVPDATAVQYTEDPLSWSAWEPYSTPRTIQLSKPAGRKAVHFRFRDEAGNESVPARILVEAREPAPDAPATPQLRSVSAGLRRLSDSALRLHVWLDGTGLTELAVKLDDVELLPRSAWKSDLAFEVPAVDGLRRLSVQAWDVAGGEQKGEALLLDRDAPAASPEDLAPKETGVFRMSLMGGVAPQGVSFDSANPGGFRSIDEGSMALLRLEAEWMLVGPLFIRPAFEYDWGKDVRVYSVGVDVGTNFKLGSLWGVDLEIGMALGSMVSKLEVTIPSFGDFEIRPGLRVSGGFRARLGERLWLDTSIDGRWTRFPADEIRVTNNDSDHANFTGAAVMAGLSWRF